jgi:hypothetical protein
VEETLQVPRISSLRILGQSFGIYRSLYWTFVVLLAAFDIPVAIGSSLIPMEDEAFCGGAALIGVLGLFSYTFQEGAMTYAAGQAYLNSVVGPIQSLRVALSRLGSLLGAASMAGLAVIGMSITIVGIPFAIYFGIRWSFAAQAIVLEGCGARASLARSSELVRGNWWRVLGTSTLIQAGQVIANLLAGLFVSGRVAAVERAWSRNEVVSSLLQPIASIVPEILAGAFFIIGMTVLYYELQARREEHVAEDQTRLSSARVVTP